MMKHKFSKILGAGLSFMLLASLLVSAIPVSASTLNWGEVSPIHDEVENLLSGKSVPGIDIVDLAISGDSIYASTLNATAPLFKSKDGGTVWVNLATTTDFPGKAVKLVAVAPDDANVVVIVTTDDMVYQSDDGGQSWSDALGLQTVQPSAVVNDVDVSVAVEGIHYVAVGGTDGTDAEVYTLKLSMAETFVARSAMPTAGTSSFTTNQTAVAAVQFSPNFDTDKTLTVVSGNTSSAYFQVFRCEKDAYTWNGAISFFAEADWGTGVQIPATELDSGLAIAGGLASASIALVPEYLGTGIDRKSVV